MKRLNLSMLPDIRKMISVGIELREVSNVVGVEYNRLIIYLKKYAQSKKHKRPRWRPRKQKG